MNMSVARSFIGSAAASTANKMFMAPPTEFVEGQVEALKSLRTEIGQLHPFSTMVRKKSTGKIPAKTRLFTLHHITVYHRNSLAEFISTDFLTPIESLLTYGKLYAQAMSSLHGYAPIVNPELPITIDEYDSLEKYSLETVNTAITQAWRSAQDVLTVLEKSQKRLGEISVSWRESVQWMDRVVAMENKKSGTGWCSELLCDVLVRLEGLKESYRPLIDFFSLQEIHLRLLQQRIISDANSRLDYTRPLLTSDGTRFPSPPVMPYPWDTVRERAPGVIRQWYEFAAPSKVFLYFHHFRYSFLLDIQVITELEKKKRSRIESHRFRGALKRLLHISEISAY